MRVFLVNFVSWSQGHAGNVGHVVFFETFRPTIGHRVTGSRWSRGSRGFFGENFVSGSQGHVDHGVCFWYILFLGHMVTLVTLCFCNIVSGSQSHAGHVGHVVFFW